MDSERARDRIRRVAQGASILDVYGARALPSLNPARTTPADKVGLFRADLLEMLGEPPFRA